MSRYHRLTCVVRLTLSLSCPYEFSQYRGWDPDKAVEDYYSRIRDHEKHYEPVEEKTWPFIRIINVTNFFLHYTTQANIQ